MELAARAGMDSAVASASPSLAFADGLGQRRAIVGTRNQPLSVLLLPGELTGNPAFETVLRERLEAVAAFQHPAFAHVRGVVHVNSSASRSPRPAGTPETDQRRLAVASDLVQGFRLSELLSLAETRLIPLEIDAAFGVIRPLVAAMAAFHETSPDAAHGALAPERIIVTADGHVVVAEYVFATALALLDYSRERYWKSLRIALPAATPHTFDQRADVTQLGAVALALIIGRPLRDDEYPARTADIVDSVRAISATGLEPLPPAVHSWLRRALQLEGDRSFSTAIDAYAALEDVGDADEVPSQQALVAFLDQCSAARRSEDAAPPPDIAPRPAALPSARETAAPPITPVSERPLPTLVGVERREGVRPLVLAHPSQSEPQSTVTTDRRAPSLPAMNTEPAESSAPPSPRSTPSLAAAPRSSSQPELPPASAMPPPLAMPAAHAPRPTSEPPAPVETSPLAASTSSMAATEAPTRPHPVLSSSSAPVDATAMATEPTPAARAVAGPDAARFTPAAIEPATTVPDRRTLVPSRRRLAAAAVGLVALASGVALAARSFMTGGEPGGTLTVTTNPSGVAVSIDGQPRGVTPLTARLTPGEHVLTMATATEVRRIPVTIADGAEVAQFIELPVTATAATEGQLQVRTDPPGAAVHVDGQLRGRSPLTIEGLSPGTHAVRLEGPLGAVTQQVEIQAGATASLVVPLSAPAGAPVSGWISITAPVEVQVYEEQRLLGTSRSDRIMVSAGRHEFELVHEPLGYRSTRVVQVTAGEVSRLPLEWPNGTLALNALPWAEVWVDGERVGETPIGSVRVPIGVHNVVFRHPELGQQSHDVTVTTAGPARLTADLRK